MAMKVSHAMCWGGNSLVPGGHWGRRSRHCARVRGSGEKWGSPPKFWRQSEAISAALSSLGAVSPGVEGSRKWIASLAEGLMASAIVFLRRTPLTRLACIFLALLAFSVSIWVWMIESSSAIFSEKRGSVVGGRDDRISRTRRSFFPCLLSPPGLSVWWYSAATDSKMLSVFLTMVSWGSK